MLVRQHVVLDEKDLKRLVVGSILTLTLDNYVIDLSLAVGHKRARRGDENHAPAALAPARGAAKRGSKRKPQRCPYCHTSFGALGPHIRKMHPGKPTIREHRAAAAKAADKKKGD